MTGWAVAKVVSMNGLCEEKTCAIVCTVLLTAVIILAVILIFLRIS